MRVDAASVLLNTDGIVSLDGSRKRVAADQAALHLQSLLQRTLDVAQGKATALRSVADDESINLEKFFTGVARALIPINRGAAKRALARLARETLRAKTQNLLTDEDVHEESLHDLPETSEVEVEVEIDIPMSATPAPVEEVATRTPTPLTPSVGLDIAVNDNWDDIDANIDLQTPTPMPQTQATPRGPQVATDLVTSDEPELATTDDAETDDGQADDGQAECAIAEEPSSDTQEDLAPMVDDSSSIDETEPDTSDDELNPRLEELGSSQLGDEARVANKLIDAATNWVENHKSDPAPAAGTGIEATTRVEALLANFGASEEGDPLQEAAISLKRMMRIDLTPAVPASVDALLTGELIRDIADGSLDDELEIDEGTPIAHVLAASVLESKPVERTDTDAAATIEGEAPLEEELDASPLAFVAVAPIEAIELPEPSPIAPATNDSMLDEADEGLDEDAVASLSPAPIDLVEKTPSSFPPTIGDRRRRRSRLPLLLSAALLLGGVLVLGVLQHQRGMPLPLQDLFETSPAAGVTGNGDTCYAKLRLKDLPSPHEVLVLLGNTPLTTQALPVGVRLELMAIAPGHHPERVVVAEDANWVEPVDGKRSLAIELALETGLSDNWPNAPAGKVGGVGPAGHIHATSTPGSELWLVAGAGHGDHRDISVPCDATATILVVNTDDPKQRRRLSVAPKLLAAAAQTGGAELSVTP